MKWKLEEITEFKRLVNMSASPHQMDRINSRLDMPHFVKKTGREKCQAMWEHLEAGGKVEAKQ